MQMQFHFSLCMFLLLLSFMFILLLFPIISNCFLFVFVYGISDGGFVDSGRGVVGGPISGIVFLI